MVRSVGFVLLTALSGASSYDRSVPLTESKQQSGDIVERTPVQGLTPTMDAVCDASRDCYDDLEESEGELLPALPRMDLASLDSLTGECVDKHRHCSLWGKSGECNMNPVYMITTCPASCHVCPPKVDGIKNVERTYVKLESRWMPQRFQEKPEALSRSPPPAGLREISLNPLVYAVENFLTVDECDDLIEMAAGKLSPAETIDQESGSSVANTPSRNNRQYQPSKWEIVQNKLLARVAHRMHRLARVPQSHSEGMQIGRYKEGEFYKSHYDASDHVARVATVLVFLEEPEEGGETIFSKAQLCRDELFEPCCFNLEKMVEFGGGFWAEPQKGLALLFYNMNLNHELNRLGAHGSCPVLQGEKWVLQQWFRDQPYFFSPFYSLS